jgi:hypothetical protein
MLNALQPAASGTGPFFSSAFLTFRLSLFDEHRGGFTGNSVLRVCLCVPLIKVLVG